MKPIITMNHITKEFKILKKREGLRGSFVDLFSREYQYIKAVNDITMNIMPGEIVGYLGPNGAGKSTTIKMMTGILEPTAGEIIVNDRIPYKNRSKNAENIGVVFGQRTQLWWALPAIESFRILKEIYRVEDKNYRDNLDFFDSLIGVSELYQKPVRQMSLGQRTLCDILASFIHNPSVVFLDEPTIGLDVSMKGKIRQLVKALNKEKGTTVILTTHDMGDVDALCKRIVIIDKGEMLYDNHIENLRSYFGAYRTLKLNFSKKDINIEDKQVTQKAKEIDLLLKEKFPTVSSLRVSVDEKWIDVLLNEDEISMMKVVHCIEEKHKIRDLSLQEISTESVIKKIYEGGYDE